MSTIVPPQPTAPVVYPESDGLPMAENTLQFQWIVTIQGGLDVAFRDRPDVFVAGDLFWYPVEGDNAIRTAPDILVVFGRPKGHRRSYLQWLEDNVAPQVTFEVLSPGNRAGEMANKLAFFDRYGIEEYYIWDPDNGRLQGWLRQNGRLQSIPDMNGWVSPLLGVRFELVDGELYLYGPDGKEFASYRELAVQRDELAVQRDEAQQRAARLAAQLRAMGVEPDA